MLRHVRRSIARTLIVAVGAPGLLVAIAGAAWLRHAARSHAPGVEGVSSAAIATMASVVGAIAVAHLVAVRFFVERPLRRLAAGMRRARDGEFLHRVPVESEDEVGVVAQSFNTTLAAITDLHARRIEDAAALEALKGELAVKAEIERRAGELAFLAELGRTLASTLELERLLAATAERVAAALGASGVQILLADEAAGTLVVRAAGGEAAPPLGASLPPSGALEGWTSAALSTTSGGDAGLLAVRLPGAASLDAAQTRLLASVAAQASMAIANARLHEQALRLSRTDPVTGAANRRSLFARLEAELDRSERFEHTTAIAIADVDHFGRYLGAFGRTAGDAVLRHVATTLGGTVRKVDLVARYMGEEFAIVLARTDRTAALAVAEKLRGAVEAAGIPNAAAGGIGHVTVSIGVAVYPDDARDLASLIDCADSALYAAKRAGRNTVRAYEPGMRAAPGRKRDVNLTADIEAGGE